MTNSSPAIRFDRVTKQFTLHRQRSRSFQELFLRMLRLNRGPAREKYLALRDVSFSVHPGEMVGIIGPNGAGKSTILKLVSRIVEPTSGHITVDGRVGALLELGTGFHPDLSGRENIYLNGSIIGLGRKKMDDILDEIIAFSEMAHFIDVPVKHYSSGMYMRLAFSIAIHVQPDILLVDEVLAVGDQSFQIRCLDTIHDMKRQGIAIVLVTHDLDAVSKLCDRAIWLHRGQIQAEGHVEHVLERYMDEVFEREEQALLVGGSLSSETPSIGAEDPSTARTGGDLDSPVSPKPGAVPSVPAPAVEKDAPNQAESETPTPGAQWGSLEARITRVQLLDAQCTERRIFRPAEPFVARLHFSAPNRIENPQFGLALFHPGGFHINGPNTVFSGLEIQAIQGEGYIDYVVDSLPLLEGTYLVSVSLYDHAGARAYDFHHQAYTFRVRPGKSVLEKYGSVLIPSEWRLGPTGFEAGALPAEEKA